MHATTIGWFGVDDDDDENCSHSTPSVAHNSPSSYISATEIPLPEDAMEDDSDYLGAMERELGSQRQSLNDIHNQLIMLIALSGGVNCSVEAPPAVANAVVAPLNPLNTTTHWLKPATPSEFTGDCTKGHAFLNSCDLYIGLAPTQFTDDQARIYWVLSLWKAIALHVSQIEPCDLHNKQDRSHGQLGLSSDLSSYTTSAQRMRSKQLTRSWRHLSTIKAPILLTSMLTNSVN